MSLRAKLSNLGLEFDELFYQKCDLFIALLQQWGAIHNLTASLKKEDIIENIIDSIYPYSFLKKFDNFVDIGTGAGFPGVLLAIAYPTANGVFLEPRNKRAAFLNFVVSALELNNIQVIANRAQSYHSSTSFDLIVSRAVKNTALLLDITEHLSNTHTKYLFYKGSIIEQEIQEAKLQKRFEVIPFGKSRNYLYINEEEDL